MDLVALYRVGGDGRLRYVAVIVVGASKRPAWVPVAPGDKFIGVRLRAGWGGGVFGVDPVELCDSDLRGEDACAVLGSNGPRLTSAETEAELRSVFRDTTRQLVRRLDHRRPTSAVLTALDLIHTSGGRVSSRDVCDACDTSERTLRRRFASTVGLSVKSYAAVLRFQRTMRLLANGAPTLSLTEAALEGGYSDQAHMTREFVRFGGFTPGRRPPVALSNLPIAGVAEIFKNDEPELD